MKTIKKIISGGQTGVDQAALQAAIDSGLDHGGWCPPGRVCESGEIPLHFDLKETPLERDPSAPDVPRSQRTIWNVRDSDGLIVFKGAKAQRDQGTELAMETVKQLGKPHLVVNFNSPEINLISEWIGENNIGILSVGGTSEATSPGIYERVYGILTEFLKEY